MGTAGQSLSSRFAARFAGETRGIGGLTMIKLKNVVRRLGETESTLPENWSDPWSHPDIRAMSMRELADLPLTAPRRK